MNLKNLFKKQKGDLPVPFQSRNNSFFAGIGYGNLFSLTTRRLPGSQRDWMQIAGDLDLNSIVSISMDYYLRNFLQCPIRYKRKVDAITSDYVEVKVLDLLKNPTDNATYSVFWSWVIKDFKLLGNAFIRKIRVNNEVVALQYLPADMMKPVGDKNEYIKGWQYIVNGAVYDLDKKDVIHWRYGRDTYDMRMGRSPLVSCLREISTDNAAASISYGFMANNAMPSIILGPDANDQTVDISEDDARTVKRRLQQDFTGDNAGGIAVMTGPFKMERASWSPEEMNLEGLRRLPEERIVSALGLNVMVLGLGAGLDHSTYSNYERAQQAAWEDGVVPLLNQLAETLTAQLAWEFSDYQAGDYIEFDLTNVRALKDDVIENSKMAERLFLAGIIDKAEAKRMCNLTVEPSDNGVMYEGVARPMNEKSIEIKAVGHKPTEGMVEAARIALDWKEEGFDGGTRVGVTRANQIVNRENLSDDTVLRMYSFFSRHEVDKNATGFNSGEEGYPSPGRVAWNLWGGDSGFSWSRKIRDKIMNEREND